jgi:hypothetical protein
MIQKVLFEQESKLDLVISKLETKANKSCELYDFLCQLAQKWGVSISRGICWFGSPYHSFQIKAELRTVTNKLNSSEIDVCLGVDDSSSPPLLASMHPKSLDLSNKSGCVSSFVAGNFSTSRLILATYIFQTGVSTKTKCR